MYNSWISSFSLSWQLLRLTTHGTNPNHTITICSLSRNKKEANRWFWMRLCRGIQRAATTLSASPLTVLLVRLLFLLSGKLDWGWNYFCFYWPTILNTLGSQPHLSFWYDSQECAECFPFHCKFGPKHHKSYIIEWQQICKPTVCTFICSMLR